jgi:hypothetical protein
MKLLEIILRFTLSIVIVYHLLKLKSETNDSIKFDKVSITLQPSTSVLSNDYSFPVKSESEKDNAGNDSKAIPRISSKLLKATFKNRTGSYGASLDNLFDRLGLLEKLNTESLERLSKSLSDLQQEYVSIDFKKSKKVINASGDEYISLKSDEAEVMRRKEEVMAVYEKIAGNSNSNIAAELFSSFFRQYGNAEQRVYVSTNNDGKPGNQIAVEEVDTDGSLGTFYLSDDEKEYFKYYSLIESKM